MGFSRPEYWSGLPCPPPGKSVQVPFIQREIMLPHHMKAPRHHHHKTHGEVWRLHVQPLLPLSSGPHLIQYEPQALCAHDGLGLHQVPQIHAHFSASPSLGNDQRWQPAQAACGEQARDPPRICQPQGLCSGLFSGLLLGAKLCTPPPNSYIEVLILSASEYNHIWR